MHQCRICGMRSRSCRCEAIWTAASSATPTSSTPTARPPFEGDPELARFAREEGSVWNREPGTRRQPR
jgi:hypothetical protein